MYCKYHTYYNVCKTWAKQQFCQNLIDRLRTYIYIIYVYIGCNELKMCSIIILEYDMYYTCDTVWY
jgi:hypothetical protein